MHAAENRRSPFRLGALPAVMLLVGVVACGGRMESAGPEPAPLEAAPEEAELTEEDFHGTYDLYMGGTPYEGEAAALTAEWRPGELVVLQGGQPTIRTDISIDPEAGEIRLWDETTSDVLCASEGLYDYTDDGTTITLALVSDPCANRAASADGARLVRP